MYTGEEHNETETDLLISTLDDTSPCGQQNISDQYTQLYTTFRISKLILLYVSPFILFFGVFGNLLSFIVLQHQRKKVSTYFYLSILSIVDLGVLLTGLTRIWGEQLTGKDIQDFSDLTCKLSIFFGHLFSYASVWIIIAVTVERFVVVKYPFRNLSKCRMRKAKISCAIIFTVICIINVHFLVLAEIQVKNGVPKCAIIPSSSALMHDIWPWIDAAVYSFLPFSILVVLNSVIVHSICKAKKRRIRMMSFNRRSVESPSISKFSKENRKTTVMLLALSCAFLLTTLPMNVAIIISSFWNNSVNRTFEELAKLHLVKAIAEMLMYINHSINFLFYCALGEKFRRAMFKIVRIMCKRRNESVNQVIRMETTGIRRLSNAYVTKNLI
ncbi:growth hormone secretagogue receptor type 1-like [Saccostrea echinata]|uniref:growth hormone secretagogue receptor type 1-like n=1 Tax=Saccostrea echinata TaxID=191078 RepID=UPI002A7FA1C1|nr:growth hormone secretagogue receptor type 1-like [Saccostrea echinata]